MKIERYIGVDGEGIGRAPHRYIYLAMVDEQGMLVSDTRDRNISTAECLDALLESPLSFGYALTYDITMWLRDLSARQIYSLARPETRRLIDESVPAPIDWYPSGVHRALRERGEVGYRIDYIRGRLMLRDVLWTGECGVELKRKTTVWDIFRFFGGPFVKALRDWGIGTSAQVERVSKMKKGRSSFRENERRGIEAYCREECQLMAQLTRKMVVAHEEAGLPLTVFFGPGSTAGVLLDKLRTKKYSLPPMRDMTEPVAAAFFGGRFEVNAIGPQPDARYAYDICSAYPYAMTSLPCLIHGQWRYLTHSNALRIEKIARESTLTLVHCQTDTDRKAPWGLLPWRSQFGEIVYPARNPGTWVWQHEYLAARRYAERSGCGEVTADRCWYYVTRCQCRPFKGIGEYYDLRKAWGREGRGIALKLGINSAYGKTAQSRGRAPYNNWIWAGVITSYTRGMLLDALSLASRPENVVMMATDGIVTREELPFPVPEKVDQLGSWKPEHVGESSSVYKDGIFLIRPGIYFPLGAHELKNVRSRGVHRKTLREHEDVIQARWRRDGPLPLKIQGNTRFVGMLTGVYSTLDGDIRRRDVYADWVDIEIEINYDPEPKRMAIRKDRTLSLCYDTYRSGGRLTPIDRESAAYIRAVSEQAPEARERIFTDLMALENAT